jgi:hypothetical protein
MIRASAGAVAWPLADGISKRRHWADSRPSGAAQRGGEAGQAGHNEKASEEHKKSKLVVMLINAVTGTKAFHEFIYPEFKKPDGKIELRFFKGRLRFINPAKPDERKPSPHDSMLVIFKP